MNFFRRGELSPEVHRLLTQYDQAVLQLLGPGYTHPVRMRDWELLRVLRAAQSLPSGSRVLDTGSFNTYLGLYLSRRSLRVTVSDLLWSRALKSALRRLRLAPAKRTEAGYLAWRRAMDRHGVPVRNIDLTRTGQPDASWDCIISISVLEHIPDIGRALAELYRVLAPGGRLLLTTDCSPEPRPYSGGVRYFSEAELLELFAPYPVTSPRNRPDFARENWCYGGGAPIVTGFVEVTKPR